MVSISSCAACHGRPVLAEEHRPVDGEVVVVGAVERVDVHRPLAGQELAVGDDRLLVVDQHVAVVAAEHVDVGGHVDQVPGIRHQIAQPVARPQRALREGRHLHQVDVEMQEPRMVPRGGDVAEGALQHVDRLRRAGALGDAPGLEVPHLPGRQVHDRLGEDGAHLEVVAVGVEHPAHGVRIGGVPRRLVLDGLALRIARGQGADQRLLDRAGAAGTGQGALHRVVGGGERGRLAGRVVEVPGQVVVRPGRVGDPPVGHGAGGVALQRLLEAGDRLGVVEAEEPVEAPVEPELGLGHGGGDLAGVRAEIVVVHVILHCGGSGADDPAAWASGSGR